ncbi:hypothetical protein LZD49_12480 [Dyadobacter sp. CY261]|uniref:hypothetical protein n=1 Tax=Dyadobacter sp. CY261 TaxID=2907203 RepID=UPI001F20D7A1|nr:hypothetical protein [Dyadobacter sp. CY261]MCF0071289.1 hypothetical protein [Dyadobacter sp. CY261]
MSTKKKITPEVGQASQQERTYEIVGLEMKPYMPVHFNGEMIDLANLTDQQSKQLIEAEYPHIIPV